MENTQDTTMTEKTLAGNASTDRGLPNDEGGFHMKREYNINKELAKSPIRNGRYQYMKGYLERNGEYHLSNRSHERFHGMTREQSEQALDDVIRMGYGRVRSWYRDGALIIECTKKE